MEHQEKKQYELSDLQKITGQKEVFIYHGNLSVEALSDPRFVGFTLYPANDREIKYQNSFYKNIFSKGN